MLDILLLRSNLWAKPHRGENLSKCFNTRIILGYQLLRTWPHILNLGFDEAAVWKSYYSLSSIRTSSKTGQACCWLLIKCYFHYSEKTMGFFREKILLRDYLWKIERQHTPLSDSNLKFCVTWVEVGVIRWSFQKKMLENGLISFSIK